MRIIDADLDYEDERAGAVYLREDISGRAGTEGVSVVRPLDINIDEPYTWNVDWMARDEMIIGAVEP
jgi:hypothetical protein